MGLPLFRHGVNRKESTPGKGGSFLSCRYEVPVLTEMTSTLTPEISPKTKDPTSKHSTP